MANIWKYCLLERHKLRERLRFWGFMWVPRCLWQDKAWPQKSTQSNKVEIIMKHASAVTYCDAQNYLNSHITPTKSHWHSFCNQTNIDFCLLLWSHSLISLQWINDFICIYICMCDRILYLQIMKLIKQFVLKLLFNFLSNFAKPAQTEKSTPLSYSVDQLRS